MAELTGVDQARLLPTVEEMEAFKAKMGIKSDIPQLGRPASPRSSISQVRYVSRIKMSIHDKHDVLVYDVDKLAVYGLVAGCC